MSYFPDLGNSCQVGHGDDMRAIGWLHPDHPFPRAALPDGFLPILERHLRSRWESQNLLGIHVCEFCPPPDFGCGTIPDALDLTAPGAVCGAYHLYVPTAEWVYIAPEMILHYSVRHQYAPPDGFVRAVLSAPDQGSDEFFTLLARFNTGTWWKVGAREPRVVSLRGGVPHEAAPEEFFRGDRLFERAEKRVIRARRSAEYQANLDAWTHKGMCAVCGAWLYFHGDSGSETHCGKPLINVIARCPALEPTRRAAALPTGPAAVRKLARALLQLLKL